MKGNHHDRHQRDQSGGDFFDMAVAALGSLPRHEVARLRDDAQAMLAAAQQVLGGEA